MASVDQRIEAVVDTILQDYSGNRDIDKMEQSAQPDKDMIIDLIDKLRRIVFPGYFREKNYQIYNAKHNLSVLIEDVMYNLSRQIELVFLEDGRTAEDAREVSLAFLSRIPQVRDMVQTDLQAAYDGDPAATGMAEVIFSYPGLFAITVYRLAHELYKLNVPMIPRIMTEHAHSITGIVVGETTIIGENVKIYQGVTLGGLSTRGGQSLRGKRRHPTIEDNVTIYANASILGGETVIGQGCVIGASAFITKSVPPCTTVSIKSQELQMKPHGNCTNCETCKF